MKITRIIYNLLPFEARTITLVCTSFLETVLRYILKGFKNTFKIQVSVLQ